VKKRGVKGRNPARIPLLTLHSTSYQDGKRGLHIKRFGVGKPQKIGKERKRLGVMRPKGNPKRRGKEKKG